MEKFIKYMPMAGFPAKKGYAIQFGLSDRRGKWVATAEMAPQVKDKPPSGSKESPFDWSDGAKIFAMLDAFELGQGLAVMNGARKEEKIIHKFPMDAEASKQTTTSLTFTASDTGDLGIGMQQKTPNDKEFRRYNIFIKPDEVEVLRIVFRKMIEAIYFERPVKTISGALNKFDLKESVSDKVS